MIDSLNIAGPTEILPGLVAVPTGGRVAFVHSSGAAALSELPVGMINAEGGFHTTVQSALAATRANRGDTVIVLPGHAENIAAADSWSNAKAGSRVWGLGWGTMRPTFTFSATASELALNDANFEINNCRFINGAADATKAFEVSAAGVAIRNCYIQASDGSNKLTTVMRLSSGANDFLMEDTDIIGGATALTDTCLINAAIARAKFAGVRMIAALGVAEGLITNATAAATNIEIGGSVKRRQSIFSNRVASSTVALKFLAGTTGNLDDCFLETAIGTVADMNGTTLPEPTLAAAINTPGALSIGRNVQVGLASGKFAVMAATVAVTLP